MIKERREALKLTQEQLAKSLGVSATAVHKWEKGSNYPDITLLPALARKLGVDLNHLLSFEENLSTSELESFIRVLSNTLQEKGFVAAFELGKDKIQQYPNSEDLLFTFALIMHGELTRICDEAVKKKYLPEIQHFFEQLAESADSKIAQQSNEQLFHFAFEQQDIHKAEKYLSKMPEVVISRKKQYQALLYKAKGQEKKAQQLLEEETLRTAAEIVNLVCSLLELAMKENNKELIDIYTNIYKQTNELYALPPNSVKFTELLLSIHHKDHKKSIDKLEDILKKPQDFMLVSKKCKEIYPHIAWKNNSQEDISAFFKIILESLEQDFAGEFKDEPAFLELMQKYS